MKDFYRSRKWVIAAIAFGIIILAVILKKSQPKDPVEVAIEFLTEHRDEILIQNAFLIREHEDIFNYGKDRKALSPLFSKYTKNELITDADSNSNVIVYPNYMVSRDTARLGAMKYIQDPFSSLVDYLLVVELDQDQSVLGYGAIAVMENDGGLDTVIARKGNFELKNALNSQAIETQIELVSELKEKDKLSRQLMAQKQEFEETCLSAWDGSCWVLEEWLKERLKDPDSYEHIETRYQDVGSHAVVVMKYRAKNSFGGYDVGILQAEVSWGCQVLSILYQN